MTLLQSTVLSLRAVKLSVLVAKNVQIVKLINMSAKCVSFLTVYLAEAAVTNHGPKMLAIKNARIFAIILNW